MQKSSVELLTRDLTHIMLTLHLMRTIYSFRLSTTWISDGKLILASFKSIIQVMDLTVSNKPLIWLKPKLKWTLIVKLSSSRNIQTSKKLGQRLRNTKRSTQMPIPFQIVSFQLTSTGEISRESTSLVNTETKVTVDPAILFLSLKLLK